MILVFGGTGQVGRGVVAGLREKGEDVRIFARDPDITQQAPVLPPRPAGPSSEAPSPDPDDSESFD